MVKRTEKRLLKVLWFKTTQNVVDINDDYFFRKVVKSLSLFSSLHCGYFLYGGFRWYDSIKFFV